MTHETSSMCRQDFSTEEIAVGKNPFFFFFCSEGRMAVPSSVQGAFHGLACCPLVVPQRGQVRGNQRERGSLEREIFVNFCLCEKLKILPILSWVLHKSHFFFKINVHQEQLNTSKFIDAFATYFVQVKYIFNFLSRKKNIFNYSQ